MNDTIRTQLAHSSVRAFTNEPVTAELRTQILDGARRVHILRTASDKHHPRHRSSTSS